MNSARVNVGFCMYVYDKINDPVVTHNVVDSFVALKRAIESNGDTNITTIIYSVDRVHKWFEETYTRKETMDIDDIKKFIFMFNMVFGLRGNIIIDDDTVSIAFKFARKNAMVQFSIRGDKQSDILYMESFVPGRVNKFMCEIPNLLTRRRGRSSPSSFFYGSLHTTQGLDISPPKKAMSHLLFSGIYLFTLFRVVDIVPTICPLRL